jgi:DNA-binding Lrp family transcriptional regulator
VKKLESLGIIESYHAKINRDKVGLGVTTFVTVTLTGHKKQVTESFVKQINQIPEVIECHYVTGNGDFVLKIISKDIASYQKLMLEKINEIEEVSGTSTMVILSTFKESPVLPI